MKIRTWHFSYNNYIQWKLGTVHCIERSLWVQVGGWFVNSVLGRGCSLLHWAKFPNWIKITNDGEVHGLRDYYGDLGCMYHSFIYNPVFQWWYRIERRNQKEWSVELGYDQLREIFGADFPDLEPVWGDD